MENEKTSKVKCINCGRIVEDLEKGCPYCEQEERNNNDNKNTDALESKNIIASIFKGIAYLTLIVGFIFGIVLGKNMYEYGRYEFNYVAMIITWLSSGISAVFFFGLAEIIQILHDIREKIYKK